MTTATPRPTILVPTRYFHPAYKAGGVARSLANLTEALAAHYRFVICCGHTDIDGSAHHQPGETAIVHGAEVHYIKPGSMQGLRRWRTLQRQAHQLLYLNSCFDPWFSLLPALLRRRSDGPMLIAPRGEFAVSALAQKAAKKRLALRAMSATGLQRGARWQASTEREAADMVAVLQGYGFQAPAPDIAMDIPGAPTATAPAQAPAPATAAALRLVLVGRVAPIKNLRFALQVLQQAGLPACLDIIGPIEDGGYWAECQRLIAELPPQVSVRHLGSLPPQQIAKVLPGYELFLLPTQGENFGHAIHEALAAGLPVLISDQTPWRDLPGRQAGWDLPLDPTAFVGALRQFAAMDEPARLALREGARRLAAGAGRDAAIEAHIQLFSGLIAASARP